MAAKQEKNTLKLKAAILVEEGYTQSAIATRLGVSQSYVSQQLKEVMDDWLVRQRPRLDVERTPFTDEQVQRYRAELTVNTTLLDQLKELDPRDDSDIELNVYANRDQLDRGAADLLSTLLKRSRLTGVSYGRTIHGVVSMLDESRAARDYRVIPICGDPTHLINQQQHELSASNIAAAIQERMAAMPNKPLPSLSGVPAYVPRELMRYAGAKSSVMSYIRRIPGYAAIFDGPQSLSLELDTLLTGVGGIGRTEAASSDFIRERLAQEPGLTFAELNQICIGDLGGILIPRHAKFRKEIDELNSGWTGLTLKHLAQIRDNATKRKAPGVIVITHSNVWDKSNELVVNRARVLSNAIAAGLVDRLVIDQQLASMLEDEIPAAVQLAD